MKELNEATENDFIGKDTIIVIDAVTGRQVQKSAEQMARRDDNGFSTVVKPVGAELYYLTDRSTAEKLTSTDLFFSSVKPADGQVMYMLSGLEPVIVRTTGRGAKSTNFGYRESNSFADDCNSLKQVMQAVFGVKDVKTYLFKTAHNDRLRFVQWRSRSDKAVEDYGQWYEVTDADTAADGRGKKLVRPVSVSWKQVDPSLKSDPVLNRVSDFDSFFTKFQPKTFSLSEDDAMMAEALAQGEFDFSSGEDEGFNPDNDANDAMDAKQFEYDEQQLDLVWMPVYEVVDSELSKQDQLKRMLNFKKLMSFGIKDAYAVYFDQSEALRVSVRYQMFDPLDEDFYESHHAVLGQIAANTPKGFVAEFADADENGSSSKFIGTKLVVGKSVDRESGAVGVETDMIYDVIETLVISQAKAVSEEEKPETVEETDQPETDGFKCDFPAWALDYVVNAETGSVSRREKLMVDGWMESIRSEGYDTNAISYGEEEFFSSEPEFGLPCECVTAFVPKKSAVNEDDIGIDYPDYSGNASKNHPHMFKAMSRGSLSVPKRSKFKSGADVKPLTVAQLLEIMKGGRQTAPVMYIQRYMSGPRSLSTSTNYAHPFKLMKIRQSDRAVVMYDDNSIPRYRDTSSFRDKKASSSVSDIVKAFEDLGEQALPKGVGLALYSNRAQAIKAVYAAYFKDNRFYMEMRIGLLHEENDVIEEEKFDPVAKYLV